MEECVKSTSQYTVSKFTWVIQPVPYVRLLVSTPHRAQLQSTELTNAARSNGLYAILTFASTHLSKTVRVNDKKLGH